MSGQADIVQLDFAAGMTRDTAPHQIDPRACWDHLNGFYDKDGSALKRGGTTALTGSAFDTSGRWIYDAIFDAGPRTLVASSDNFGVLAGDDASVLNLGGAGVHVAPSYAFTAGMLFIGSPLASNIYGGSRKTASYTTSGGNTHLTNGSAVVTDSTGGFTANVDAGMLLQRGSERVYVVASVDSDTQLTLRDAYAGVTTTTANPVLYPLYTITDADPYRPAEHYAVVANRLVRAYDNIIEVAEELAPDDWTATIVGGIPPSVPTTHELPDGVEIRGLSVVGQTLLIHSSGGMWSLEGLQFVIVDSIGTPQHRLAVLSRDMIVWGQSGIADWHQAQILPCLDGIYTVDGVSGPQPVSTPIDELYRDYVARGYQPGGAVVARGHYLLPILSASGSAVKDMLVCRLDRLIDQQEGTHPWSRFMGRGGRLAALTVRVPQTPDDPKLLGIEHDATARVVDATAFFDPSSATNQDVDETISWAIVTRDFETGGLAENMVRWLKSRFELVGTDATVDFDYGFGFREQTGYNWDEWCWADDVDVAEDVETELFWAGDDEDPYIPLSHPGGPSNGTTTHRCPVNVRARYIRFRVRSESDVTALRLRSLEVFVRQGRNGRT